MFKGVFLSALTLLGAFSFWQNALFPSVGGLPAWAVNLAAGAGSGLVLAAALWTAMNWGLRRDKTAQDGAARLARAGGFALAGALLGAAIYFALHLSFPEGPALRAVGGLLVWAGAALGFGLGLGFGAGAPWSWSASRSSQAQEEAPGVPKVLDTSVIIDGRIGDLVKTGFIEGRLILPQFILDELHAIADSSDNLRRRKGRRGLDILNDMLRNPKVAIETLDRDPSHVQGVDRKLITLAKELGARLLTTDYNLNKVAKVEGIQVLNVNELANAVKPRFIPGEDLEVEVIDKGEEIGQGIGYLDDGTMVVVENGRRFIGRTIQAVVSSTLQTEAGKMLFVRPKGEVRSRSEGFSP